VQPRWCKDGRDSYSKLLIKASLLIKLYVLKDKVYSVSLSGQASFLPELLLTPYVRGNKALVLFLFFRETLIRFIKLFNLGLSSLHTIAFMLPELKVVTKHSLRERTVTLTALKFKKSKTIRSKRVVLKSSRRKVLTSIPRAGLTNKKLFKLRRRYMSLYRNFLTYKQRKAKPQLPIKYKNRFLRRHAGLKGEMLRYTHKKGLKKVPKGKRLIPYKKVNPAKFPKLSFFIDTTFAKIRSEIAVYNKKKEGILLAATRLAAKESRKARRLANHSDGVNLKTNTPVNSTNKGRVRRPRVIIFTTYRGVKIRKKIIRHGRDVQKEITKAIKNIKNKNKYNKPLQDFESFNASTKGIMLDWLVSLGSKESILLGKSRILARYKLIRLKIRRRRFRRRRRRTFIKIRQRIKRRNLKRQLRLNVSNYINPWFLNKLAQHNYKFKSKVYNLFSVYNSITRKVNNIKSYTLRKNTILLPQLAFLNLYKSERCCSFFRFNTDLNLRPVSIGASPRYSSSDAVGHNTANTDNLLGFSKKIVKLPKINNNIFLWLVVKLLKVDTFTFSNSSLAALLGVLPSFYLYKAIRRSDNRFLYSYYKSNFVLPNLNLAKVRKFKKLKKNTTRTTSAYGGYSIFLGTILTSWLESPTSVVILNLKMFFVNLAKSKLLSTLVKKNIRFHYKVGTGFFIKEAVQVILLSLSLKDPVLLMSWFTKIMEKVQFFKHKNYIMFFKSVFNNLNQGVFRRMGIRGLYFDIRGKLAVKGDSKKRHILLRYGECTFSQKSIKISPAYGTVHTFTGVLGVTFILFY
jgi:hypothetical protein